jgi:hypothetical protein
MLSRMPEIPPPVDLPPLLTDDDGAGRAAMVIGAAARDGTLWLLFVDGDGRQAPVVMPVDDTPPLPDDVVMALGDVLAGVMPDLATAAGPGSVVFVRERLGPDDVLPADRSWAEALDAMCRGRRIHLRGIHLSTPDGVRRMP